MVYMFNFNKFADDSSYKDEIDVQFFPVFTGDIDKVIS